MRKSYETAEHPEGLTEAQINDMATQEATLDAAVEADQFENRVLEHCNECSPYTSDEASRLRAALRLIGDLTQYDPTQLTLDDLHTRCGNIRGYVDAVLPRPEPSDLAQMTH